MRNQGPPPAGLTNRRDDPAIDAMPSGQNHRCRARMARLASSIDIQKHGSILFLGLRRRLRRLVDEAEALGSIALVVT
jgi:hypothetical protein